jgi:subtilisin family serine protease
MNPDSPRDPHSASGYLRTAPVQHAVRAAVGTNFGQAVRNFVIARDLAAELEDAPAESRREVLVQLVQPKSSQDLAAYRARLQAAIREVVPPEQHEAAAIETLQRFVSAQLTRSEVERLRARSDDYHIDIVWRDAGKRALIYQSAHTVQASPATLGYGARGQGIRWAVLDTGIRADHPHFDEYKNIEKQWNCVLRGRLDDGDPQKTVAPDGHGHGTHVAGIIAGRFRAADEDGAPRDYIAMAPETKLHIYKVLDDRGLGSDSRIIKALDHIAETNELAGQLIIHGVNLSLGGAFDPSVYGCGHSPLCQELRRLWRQGVVVCVAAGNEGYLAIRGAAGEELNMNTDLSVGDPANLEECVAVGSVHKLNPHTFGVSFFSSRGPTADGRLKPDCVAPGEKICSACHRFDAADIRPNILPPAKDVYIEMSGTSMATPHVSGVLAGYLSMRREFIGYPDKVKKVLLENCTDIARDRYMQGAGIPNLVKMLLNS